MATPSGPATATNLSDDDVGAIDRLRTMHDRLKKELAKVIIGQNDVIERLAICMFARGHALLMGVPGLAKTLLVSKLGETLSLHFNRIQFTPDLMPMDITGTDILQDGADGRREFQFVRGPVFANIVLRIRSKRLPMQSCWVIFMKTWSSGMKPSHFTSVLLTFVDSIWDLIILTLGTA